jgi:membrane-associated protein
MEFVTYLIDLFLNLDKHINELIIQYGTITYLILFLVIFAETGFVFTPFLPGDSLLFAAGALCARDSSPLSIHYLFLLLVAAAITGDNLNYWIGRKLGRKLFELNWKVLKKEYLEKTYSFYDKHGGKTIILARFFPIIRTFSPFVAGLGKMNYKKFLINDIAGGILWVGIFSFIGYFFGNLVFVKNNFSFIVLAIIVISLTPGIIEFIRHRSAKQK